VIPKNHRLDYCELQARIEVLGRKAMNEKIINWV